MAREMTRKRGEEGKKLAEKWGQKDEAELNQRGDLDCGDLSPLFLPTT